MGSSFEHELHAHVVAYVSGRRPLREFQEWFAPAAWALDERESPDDAHLAGAVELLLAEWSNGHWTEDELKEKLSEYAVDVEVLPSPLLQRSTSAVVGRQPGDATVHVGQRWIFAKPRLFGVAESRS